MKKLILFLVVFGFACNASAAPLNTSAEIVTSITIPEQFSFDIGLITGGVVDRALTFDAGGTTSSASDSTLPGGEQGGVFRLVNAGTPAPATVTVTVTVIGTTLASGDDTTVIVANCRESGGALNVDNGNCTVRFNEVIDDDVNIGGKLTVGASPNPPVLKLEP